MTPEQALNIISQAMATVKATLQDHQQIQAALKVLSEAITDKNE
jgi:hypothetical protein